MADLAKVVEEYKAAMQLMYGERLQYIVLYGSYARGDFHSDSDIDFLVVLNDPDINLLSELRKMSATVNEIAMRHNVYISSKPTTLTKAENSVSPFYYWVRKEGKKVA